MSECEREKERDANGNDLLQESDELDGLVLVRLGQVDVLEEREREERE